MKYLIKKLLLSVIIFFSTFIYAQDQIGHFNVIFQDPDRSNRNIDTEIYYPATISGDSTLAAIGEFPVIIFGHGFVMTWDAYQNLWEEFVPKGYIMVFPKTEGSLFSTNHQEFGWDLQFLVTKIQDEGQNNTSPIYNIVANNTALMGHSMGGGASFLAADSLCVNGNTQLKTIIGLAPAESSSNGVSSIASAANVTVPSIIFSGSQDGVTPPADHHIPIYDNLSSDCKIFISIFGGGHCYFANSNFNCDFGESISSTGISITRTEQQAVTYDFLNLWLDYTLKNDCNDFSVFQDSLSTSNRISSSQICLPNPVAIIIENEGTLVSSITGIGYQWYLNDQIIIGANEIDYTPTISGEYNVEVFFTIGCPTFSDSYIFSEELKSLFNIKPNSYLVYQNYPNPFNPITTIRYDLPEDAKVIISVYDIIGREIKTLIKTNQSFGSRSISWDGTNDNGEVLPGGIYYYLIKANTYRKIKKMIFLK